MIQEFFEQPDSDYPTKLWLCGAVKFDGQNCIEYREYQWIPESNRHSLISVTYAPYCDLSESPEAEKQRRLYDAWNVARLEFCRNRLGWANVDFYANPGSRQSLACGFFPLQSSLDENGQSYALWQFTADALDAIGRYLAAH